MIWVVRASILEIDAPEYIDMVRAASTMEGVSRRSNVVVTDKEPGQSDRGMDAAILS